MSKVNTLLDDNILTDCISNSKVLDLSPDPQSTQCGSECDDRDYFGKEVWMSQMVEFRRLMLEIDQFEHKKKMDLWLGLALLLLALCIIITGRSRK